MPAAKKRKPKKAAEKESNGRNSSVRAAPSGKTESIGGILLLLEEQDLSAAVKWYVQRLSEIYDEIETGKAPKVKLEILQELRDFIIPVEERKPVAEIFDPAVESVETKEFLKVTGTDHA